MSLNHLCETLHQASTIGHPNCIKTLLNYGHDINSENTNGCRFSCKCFNGYEQPDYHFDRWGGTPLHYAAKHGHYDCIKLLIDNGADVNVESNENTPLQYALYYNHIECIIILIKNGADPNVTYGCGQTPLHYVSSNGNNEYIKLFLEKGADVNVTADYEGAPILSALRGHHDEAIKILLNNGADVNIKDCSGSIPLHIALESGCSDICIRTLLDYGADINQQNYYKGTPRYLAYKKNRGIIDKWLEDNKVPIKEPHHT